MLTRHTLRRKAAYQSHIACGGPERLGLLDPQFNLRECTKQMLLLEDHLHHSYKHCPDCIRKHLLTVEAFAEEAVALDTSGKFRALATMLAEFARGWLEDFEDGKQPSDIAQRVRVVRKNLASKVADPRSSLNRVAARYINAQTPCPHNTQTKT